MANRKGKVSKWKIVALVIIVCLLAVTHIFADKLEVMVGYNETLASHQTTKDKIEGSDYYVSFIDVGQGNSSFVKLPDGKTMLIDGGDKEYGETVAEFLEERNVSQIDYLIATHSDSDHIGGLNYIIENFEIKTVYRPFQISMNTSSEVYEYEDLSEVYEEIKGLSGDDKIINKVTTKVYRDFIKNIYTETYTFENSVLETQVCVFYDGLKISGDDYEIEFFAPLRHSNDFDLSDYPGETKGFATMGYSNANDMSAIFTLTCFDDKYLFMGDSRFTNDNMTKNDYSEWDFIQSLSASEKLELAEVDVLLLPHHGSKTSTSSELLEIVLPRFVIVSAGKDNTYGHPTPETLERVKLIGSLEADYLLRTDEMGDIIFSAIEGNLNYCVEKQGTNEILSLSFRMLCVVIAGSFLLVIFAVRVPKRRRARR